MGRGLQALVVLLLIFGLVHAQQQQRKHSPESSNIGHPPSASPASSPTIEVKNAAWREIAGLMAGWVKDVVLDALYQLALLVVLLWFAFGHLYGEYKEIMYQAQQPGNTAVDQTAKGPCGDSTEPDHSGSGLGLDDIMESKWAGAGIDMQPHEHTLFHVLQRGLRLHTPDYLASEGQRSTAGTYDYVSAPCIGVPVHAANSSGRFASGGEKQTQTSWRWVTYGEVHRRSADIIAGLDSLELLHCPAPPAGGHIPILFRSNRL
jgi:hypothetical protein